MVRRQPPHRLLGLAAGLCLCASACSQQPVYFANVNGLRAFGCYLEKSTPALEIEFARSGLAITDGGKRIRLQFSPSIWPRMEDRYEGDGYVLTLDPEAHLIAPDGKVRGPCL